MLTRFRYALLVVLSGGLVACGGGPASTPAPTPTPAPIILPPLTPTPTPISMPTPAPSPAPVASGPSISGKLSYDFVPNLSNGGLNYSGITREPIKGAVVQLLSSTDAVVTSTISDDDGDYRFRVDTNTDYRVRVLARLERSQQPAWNVSVTDNTDNNALYAMEGDLLSSGDGTGVRDLHADSGWNLSQNSYDNPRVAAPFAILDSVYQVLDTLESEGFSQNFPATELRWSVNNTANIATRNFAIGDIGTSFFTTAEGGVMYILGEADNDTDEYDRSVVQHEFGHYLESSLARSESMGGPHAIGALIDPRLAFGEGFANALTAEVSGTGFYQDSSRAGQTSGFRFSLESLNRPTRGWYSEDSVGNIIFDIVDSNVDQGDSIDLTITDVINLISSPSYMNSPALTTIYLFLHELKAATSSEFHNAIDLLAARERIIGTGIYGEGETNSGDLSVALPVYHQLTTSGTPINVCSRADDMNSDTYLGVHRLIRFNADRSGAHTIRIVQTSGLTDRDPDAVLWRGRLFRGQLISSTPDEEVGSVNLQAGEHTLHVFDSKNTDDVSSKGAVCFDVSVTRR